MISSKCLSSVWCGRHLAFPLLTSTVRLNDETGRLYLVHSNSRGEGGSHQSDLRSAATAVVVRQVRGKEEELGTGAVVWDVAILMAEMMVRASLFGAQVRVAQAVEPLDIQSSFSGKTVLELGAGTGYVGLMAHHLGAHLTLLTDVEALMPTLNECKRLTSGSSGTGSAGQSSSSIRCEVLEWGGEATAAFLRRIETEMRSMVNAPSSSVVASPISFNVDYVIVCECIVPRLYPIAPLVETLKAIADHSPRVKVLVGYEHRLYPYWDPRVVFNEMMRDVGGFHRSDTFTETVMSELRMVEHRTRENGPQVVPADDMYLWEFTRATSL